MIQYAKSFFKNQISQVRIGGLRVFFTKVIRAILLIPVTVLALLFLLIISVLQPFYLVRLGGLISNRLGHFAGNTEVYLCERDAGINVPNKPYIDIFYMWPICNQQLAKMWKRELIIAPGYLGYILLHDTNRLIDIISRIIPSLNTYLKAHLIGSNINSDRDVLNLLDQTEKHIEFNDEEEAYGQELLKKHKIPTDAKIVLLTVRDDAYLDKVQPHNDWSYHNYRNCDINNFLKVSEELANRGYFVIRMGHHVQMKLNSKHPLVIDYATTGIRDDFMDIYLASICTFIITTGTGADGPAVFCFRKPTVVVDFLPFGYLPTYKEEILLLSQHLILQKENRELKLSEIFSMGIGFCTDTACYDDNDIQLEENTPEEIRDIVVEMVERLEGDWIPEPNDETLQKKFWEIFPTDAVNASNKPLHGEIRARFGANFLRDNSSWIE